MKKITLSEQKYSNYIKKHQNNVALIYWQVKDKIVKILGDNEICEDLHILIVDHDNSKFSDKEFESYRQYFFPDEDEVPNKKLFKIAWNFHQKTNPHHWQFWLMYDVRKDAVSPIPMFIEYILEMLCDWAAMSLANKGSLLDWYNANKKEMKLHEETRAKVEELLPTFHEAVCELILERGEQ